jgi:hypothetical protein
MSWEDRWRAGETRWDVGGSAPALLELVERGDLPNGRTLVPGCGAGYDVLTLARGDRRVIGLDIAPSAAERFASLREASGIAKERAEVVVTDFFAYRPAAPFDLIWDYTFLCALDPSQRPEWAQKIDELLAPDGELATLIFPVTDTPPLGEGPPFPLRPEHLRELLEPRYEPFVLEPVARSHPRRQGFEWLGRWRRVK